MFNMSSRREVLKGGILVITALAAERLGLFPELDQLLLTGAQKEAIKQFNNTPAEERLHGLVVADDGAKLRRHPDSTYFLGSEKGNNSVDPPLEPGTIVPVAISVEGNNPHDPNNKKLRDEWYFIPGELDALRHTRSGFFAYSGLFIK